MLCLPLFMCYACAAALVLFFVRVGSVSHRRLGSLCFASSSPCYKSKMSSEKENNYVLVLGCIILSFLRRIFFMVSNVGWMNKKFPFNGNLCFFSA